MNVVMERPTEQRRSIDELLHADRYTDNELARLVGVPVWEIREEAFTGRLRARIVNHQVIDIERDDAMRWLQDRS
jgi:hypothetical protein